MVAVRGVQICHASLLVVDATVITPVSITMY